MAQQTPESFSLPSPPNDGITSLLYLPSSSSSSSSSSSTLLASTSWDGALRVHDVPLDAGASRLVLSRAMGSGPLLSLAASSGEGGAMIYAGGSDGAVRRLDVTTSTVDVVGRHSRVGGTSSSSSPPAASCLSSLDGLGRDVVASAGWDREFHLWDVRTAGGDGGGGGKPVASATLPGKAFGMDASRDGRIVVVATSGRRNCFLDVRRLPSSTGAGKSTSTSPSPADDDNDDELAMEVEQLVDRESSLKYQTRCVKLFGMPNSVGIAVGSIEGRVAIEYMDDVGIKSGGGKKYAFKCHRVGETIYPVNAIALHPVHGTLATGGADGTVVTWDAANKKKLSVVAKCPTSISALAFNGDGTRIAIASSYTFEEGERDHPREEIYVRDVLESEVMPKSKK